MTGTQTLQSVAATTRQPAELSHEWCCDYSRGLCGADLTGYHDCPDDLSCGCEPCVVCEDLVDAPCAVTCRAAS